MGDHKVKARQIFNVSLTGKQRHALYQVFEVSTQTKEREERRRFARAYEALDLAEFEDLFPERDDAGNITAIAAAVFDARINAMSKGSVLTYENVEATLTVIDSGFKSGSFNGRGVRALGPIENLLEACKRGEYQAAVDESAVEATSTNGQPEAAA